jgi:hypothetical protein
MTIVLKIDRQTSEELLEQQQKELRKQCISCDPAVPNNGGAVTEGNLTFMFAATCTLDYFLIFMRLAFINNENFRNFLKSAAKNQNMVAKTLLKMELFLYALDWNMARMIWTKFIGVIDRAIVRQHQSIEEKLVQNIYINCFGSQDMFFANHLSDLFQRHERQSKCNNINCPMKEETHRKSYLSFKYILVIFKKF